MRRNSTRMAATAAAIAAMALCATSAQAATTCDPLGDVFCATTGQSIQLTFTTFTPGALSNGRSTGIAGGVTEPSDPYLPPNPSTAIAEGNLAPTDPFHPVDPFHPYAIGRIYAPNATRSTYLFDGHLVPATSGTLPTDTYSFLGMFLPPNPI